MVSGISGILNSAPIDFKPKWCKSSGVILFPNGSTVETFSAKTSDLFLGHHFVWGHRVRYWHDLSSAWTQINRGLRGPNEGIHPQVMITTTPAPLRILGMIAADPRTHVTHGSSFENSENLPPSVVRKLKELVGTRLAEQEIFGKIIRAPIA